MPTLVTIPFSHFCEKARWALDHAGLAYREEGHAPLLHRRAVRRACGKAGSVPLLVLDDGGVLHDSPLIVRWADARAAGDHKLLPPDGAARDEAFALERRLDVELAPHVRRLAYFHVLADRPRALALMGIATPRFEHNLVRAGYPLLRALMRRAMRIDEKGAQRSRDEVRRIFDELGERLSDGRRYLLGDRFCAVDLAFAAFASPLLLPDEHPVRRSTTAEPPPGLVSEGRAVADTPAGRFALRVYREHRAVQRPPAPPAAAE
jgi:glutathione S-transferase